MGQLLMLLLLSRVLFCFLFILPVAGYSITVAPISAASIQQLSPPVNPCILLLIPPFLIVKINVAYVPIQYAHGYI